MGQYTCEPIKCREKIKEVLRKAREMDIRIEMFMLIQLHTGLRGGDVIKLKVKDVLDTHVDLIEEKNSKRNKSILGEIREELDYYIAEKGLTRESYLFPGRYEGKHISLEIIRTGFRKLAKELGLRNFNTHSMRKTYGYMLYNICLENGEDALPILISAFNHNSVQTTLKYIGLDQEKKDKLNSMLKFK